MEEISLPQSIINYMILVSDAACEILMDEIYDEE